MRDVAHVAGVAPTTVSRASSEPDTSSPGTLGRIQSVSRELGHTVVVGARPSRSASSGLLPDIGNPVFSRAIESAARAGGRVLLIGPAGSDARPADDGAGQLDAGARGFAVPGDLSVVGRDDIDVAALHAPAPTTVRQPRFAKGRAAVACHAARIEAGPRPMPPVVLAHDLVERGSAGPPPCPRARAARRSHPADEKTACPTS